MKLNKFKLFSILILIFFLFSMFNSLISAEERGLEVEYPDVEGGITTSTTISEYAAYIFRLSMIIAAILAFAVLIYGGFRYLTSAGNPIAMSDAKSWIFGGIIGLVLLLCSYIILTIIEPGLVQPDVKPIEPVGGIYLISEKGEKRDFYSIDVISEIPENFNAVQIEFISDPPLDEKYDDPNKEELISIFYYSETNREGEIEKVENNKTPGSSSPSSAQGFEFTPRSLYFLWQKPGVYLYGEENFKTPPIPMVNTASQKTLKDFSDKARSIAFVEEKDLPWEKKGYTAVLFEDTDYEGTCELKAYTNENIADRLKNKVSSITISQGLLPYGEIIFYDKINCEGKEHSVKLEEGLLGTGIGMSVSLDSEDTGLDQCLSLKINGNFSVLMNTEKNLEGRCMLFSKVGCTPTFKGTHIYSADPESFRPKAAYIFPTIE